MTFRVDLTAAAYAFAPLTQLVGDKITWRVRDQGKGLPALVLTLVSGPRTYTLQKRDGLIGRLIQFDGWAETAEDAEALELAIVAFADTLTAEPFGGGFVESSRDGDDLDEAPQPSGATDFYRTSIDARIWHREP